MPPKLDDCVKQVKAQIEAGKVKVRKDKTAEETAYAICNASLKSEEAVRWLKDGEFFYNLDPETLELKEAKQDQIPESAPVAQVWGNPDREVKPKPVHSHRHTHDYIKGETPHTHEHEHLELHDESETVFHDHSHPDGLKIGESADPTRGTTSTAVTEAVTTSEMPIMQGDKKKTMDEADKKCPECGAPMEMKDGKEVCSKDLKHTAMKKEARTMFFGELCSLKESVVDEVAKTIDVTLIEPGWSKNGRYYSKEALGKAVPIFDGAKCYVDHPKLSEEKDRPERSVRDLAGYYTNVRQSDTGALKGMLNISTKLGEEMYPAIVTAATKKPDFIGLSINALGKTKMGEAEGRKGVIVEEFAQALGTDIVTTASAGGKFDRLMASGDEFTEALLKTLEYDEWRNANADYVARIKNEMRTARKEELETAAVKEAEQLKETITTKDQELTVKDAKISELTEAVNRVTKEFTDKLAEADKRVNELVADQKLTQSKLPKEWVESLKPQLIGKTETEMDVLVEAEKVKFFAVKQPVPVRNPNPEAPDKFEESALPNPDSFKSPQEWARAARAKLS